MRIKLKEGKQKELILKAKTSTWKELADKLSINVSYISGDLRRERTTLSGEVYNKLCQISNSNFDNYIVERLGDNWGRIKGGTNSPGSLIEVKNPERNEQLAEIIGAILGDGNVNYYKKGKKIGVYQIKIAGDYILDKDYHMNYLHNLFNKGFNINGKELIVKGKHERFIYFSSRKLVEFLISQGLEHGDKIKNKVRIPDWVFENEECLKACIRGLIDTDGSIFKMSNKDPQLLRINFTNYNKSLLNDVRAAFIKLGFHPSKIIMDKQFFISKKEEISKYLKEIGFSNKKHLDRLNRFKTAL